MNGDLCLEYGVLLVHPVRALDLNRDMVAIDEDAPIEACEELLEHGLDGLVRVVADRHGEGQVSVEDLPPLFLRSLLVFVECFGAVSGDGLLLEYDRADVTLLTFLEALDGGVGLCLEPGLLELCEQVRLALAV